MTFKDNLTGKRKSPTAIFHKFRVDSSIRSRWHVFVEGYEDVGFYSRHVPTTKGIEPKFHICLGKKVLDEVARLYWSSNISASLILFIRDSDFDGFLGIAPSGVDMFVTCGYAVENYVCSAEALKSYLSNVLCLDEDEVDIANVVDGYVTAATAFHEWLSPLYGAVFVALKAGRKVDLNKFKIEDHFALLLKGSSLGEITSISELEAIGLDQADFSDESLDHGRQFSQLPALNWIRGKFLLTILTLYLRKQEAELRRLHKIGSISRFNKKAAAQINEAGVFDRLSGLAIPPKRLLAQVVSAQPANSEV